MSAEEDRMLEKLHALIQKQINENSLGIFKQNITFRETRLVESWEKSVNLTRPEKIELPLNKKSFSIDRVGIHVNSGTYEWSVIAATGIKEEIVRRRRRYVAEIKKFYLLIGLRNGRIIQIETGDSSHLYGLLGHFIEEYKLLYKEANPD